MPVAVLGGEGVEIQFWTAALHDSMTFPEEANGARITGGKTTIKLPSDPMYVRSHLVDIEDACPVKAVECDGFCENGPMLVVSRVGTEEWL
jgi:hypothetical protein